jgi:dTDP-L-rhamnose 4-epimerase
MSKYNVLITGGAGFIGSNLALALKARGHTVTVMDNLSPQIHGDKSALLSKIENEVRFIKGDVRSRSDWITALDGQDVVVHLAAETGTGQSMYEIERYVDVNVRGTSLFLDILAGGNCSVKKMLVASSRAIYGEGKYECAKHGVVYPLARVLSDMTSGDFAVKCPVCASKVVLKPTDEESRIHPTSVYGISKQVQEQLIMTVGRSLGIPSVSLRYQNVYGPGQSLSNPYTGILSIFSTRIKNGNEILIFEDGNESRDFVYIDDVVEATVSALENPEADFEIFNVGSGAQTDVMTLAKLLVESYSSNVSIRVTGEFRLGDIRDNYADLTKIKNKLGFTPKTKFADGISQFTDWVNTQSIAQDDFERSITEMKARGLYK